MKISVCIPTIHPGTLRDTIRSIQEQTHQDWTLLIVGQGPEPRLREIGKQFASDPRIRYVHSDKMGASLARNLAIRAMDAELIAFLDDDCAADKNWLAEVICSFQDEQIGMVAGPLVAPPQSQPGIGYIPKVHDMAVDGIMSGNMALRASTIKKAGLFDELLGVGARFRAGEDMDYFSRVSDAHIKFVFAPKAIVNHTYGWRYGLKAVFKIKTSYSFGYGAFVAKREMSGINIVDHENRVVKAAIKAAILSLNPRLLLFALLRAYYWRRGYHTCKNDYRLDTATGVLVAKQG